VPTFRSIHLNLNQFHHCKFILPGYSSVVTEIETLTSSPLQPAVTGAGVDGVGCGAGVLLPSQKLGFGFEWSAQTLLLIQSN